jgi:hypothetical protein
LLVSEPFDFDARYDAIERSEKRYAELRAAGLLGRAADELGSIEEVAEFVWFAYATQRREGGRLPLAVAEPDALVERTIELAGELGIRDARLRKVLHGLAKKRLEVALRRLEGAGLIEYESEVRTDARGTLRKQVIWHYCATTARQS